MEVKGLLYIREVMGGHLCNPSYFVATVSQEPGGKYYVSLCCTDVDIKPFEKTGSAVGIDLGIKEFCITSDGEMIPNPKYLKEEC